MSHEIWAAYSVRDHVEPGAFLADVVMYDKLVVPVPSDEPGEWGRWEAEEWDPARQQQLIAALGDRVRAVPWDEARRQRWGKEYETADRRQAGALLRAGLAYWLTGAQILDAAPAMATGVAATTPYRSLEALQADFGIEPVAGEPLRSGTVMAVVGRELLTPHDDSRDELELLREAVKATADPDFRIARAALHERLAGFIRGEQTDAESVRAAVAHMNTEVGNMHRALAKRKIWTTARRVFSFGQIALGALSAPINPLSLGLVVSGVGTWAATERLSSSKDIIREVPDIAMLIDVKNQLKL